jgi:hypothetical protein
MPGTRPDEDTALRYNPLDNDTRGLPATAFVTAA